MNALEFDNRLQTNFVVDDDMLKTLIHSYEYDSASTVNWLVERLILLKKVLLENKEIQIRSNHAIVIKTQEDLEVWISEKFPFVLSKIFPI